MRDDKPMGKPSKAERAADKVRHFDEPYLAKFAQDVIALNRQELSERKPCQVASLESLKSGLIFKRKEESKAKQEAEVIVLARAQKEK